MRAIAVSNVATKLVLVAAIVFMLTNPDLPQFENKSLTLRAVLYPIFSLLIAAGYYLKGMKGGYPPPPGPALEFHLHLRHRQQRHSPLRLLQRP
jgi:hypothetical protein